MDQLGIIPPPNILQQCYHFLLYVPYAHKGYSLKEAMKLVEKNLQKRGIPLSDFVAYTTLQEGMKQNKTVFQQDIF